MLAYDLDPFSPTTTDIVLYVQLLKNSGKTPHTIKNYISGAKTFLQERSYPAEQFSDYLLTNFMKGVECYSDFIPTQAPPLPSTTIRDLCCVLRLMSREGIVIAAAVLFAYATMLRQCHLFYTPTGYQHMLTRADLKYEQGILYVTVRSSKTTDKSNVSIIPVLAISPQLQLLEPLTCSGLV